MAGPPHHFMPGLNQQGIRNQFGSSLQSQMNDSMQNQLSNRMQVQLGATLANQMMGQMGNQLATSMGNQMSNQIGGTINSAMANQINGLNSGGNQMMAQQYGLNNTNAIQQQTNAQIQQLQQQTINMQQHHTAVAQPQQIQQVWQQTNNVAPAPTPTPPAQQQPQQAQQYNIASLCRLGQETVQDIVSRTQEVFQTLKQIQPPNGTPQGSNAGHIKKTKVQEQLTTIRLLFKRLRVVYGKCNENCQIQGMEYTHIESLIPYKDELDPKHDENKNTEAYRSSCEEMKEVMEQVVLKNKQLKDVIDILRRIIWEINTMLTMRRS